jgi:hypothetical protein
VRARRRIEQNKNLQPLLVSETGDWVAARKSMGKGTLIVLTSSYPLTNDGLRDPATARYVYSTIVAPALGAAQARPNSPSSPSPQSSVVVFDESLKSAPPELGGEGDNASFEQRMVRWLLRDPIGGATTYAATLVFLYLLLSGRRLGPALRPIAPGGDAGATAGGRTMYEHVQALAGLYRRGHQLLSLRAHFARRYRRLIARTLGTDAPLAARRLTTEDLQGLPADRAAALVAAISQIENAGSERQLGEAVRRAEQVTAALTATGRPGAVSRGAPGGAGDASPVVAA